ncbi:MAG: metal-dependent hydrolase [archaeon]|nr:metal-dependent hydrolase [archaeon]
MDFFTHAILGALIYNTFIVNITSEYLFYAILFVILPDFDVFLIPVRKLFKSDYLEHRGGSHSFIIGIIVALFGSIIFSLLFSKSFLILWIIGSTFYTIHLCMDLLTTTLIPIFYPISKKEYSFYVEKAGSMFTMVFSVIVLVIGLLIYQQYSYILLQLFNRISLLIYIGYYSYRVYLKKSIISKKPQSQTYLPRVIPSQYFLYDYILSGEKIQIRLMTGNHNNHPKEILSEEWTLSSQEMELYHQAVEICNEDYYLNKWTKIPFFKLNENSIQITFFFLETMMNGKSMGLEYLFHIPSKKIIKSTQKYGRIYSKKQTS